MDDSNTGNQDRSAGQAPLMRILWIIGLILSTLISLGCCMMSLSIAFYSCLWPNFPLFFSVTSLIALGVSLWSYQKGKIRTALYLAFLPIAGQLFWVLINLGPSGCGSRV